MSIKHNYYVIKTNNLNTKTKELCHLLWKTFTVRGQLGLGLSGRLAPGQSGTELAPGSNQSGTELAPGSNQSGTDSGRRQLSPGLSWRLALISPGLSWRLALISPGLSWRRALISPGLVIGCH